MGAALQHRGEVVDFAEIYRDNAAYLWRMLRRLGVAERHVADVVHDVFVVVHRQLDSYDTSRPLRPWLAGIAYRVASEHRRRAVTRRELLDDEGAPEAPAPDANAAQAQLVAREQCRRLRAALERLEEDRRVVFMLHEVEGHTMPQIAEIIGAPLNTLYSRLRLARRDIRRALDEAAADGDVR